MFCNIKIPDTSLNMPVGYMYTTDRMVSENSQIPTLRSRAETFFDLSSRFSALPDTSSSFSSSKIYKHDDSGRITTAYAITVTAINNRESNIKSRTVKNQNSVYATSRGSAVSAAVRIVEIKKPHVVDKPLPLTPTETSASDDSSNPRKRCSGSREKDSCAPHSSQTSRFSYNDNIDRAGRLDVIDIDGKKLPFRSLYSSSAGARGKRNESKVLTVFIRPSPNCRVRLSRFWFDFSKWHLRN